MIRAWLAFFRAFRAALFASRKKVPPAQNLHTGRYRAEWGMFQRLLGTKPKALLVPRADEVWYRWYKLKKEFVVEYEMLMPGEESLCIRDRSESAYPEINIESATERFRGFIDARKRAAH